MVLALVVVNLAAIGIFFFEKSHRPGHPGQAAEFLVKELAFSASQKDAYTSLVKEHRSNADVQRSRIMKAKNDFFDLLKQPSVSDTTKKNALKEIAAADEELDLNTFNHFQKVRALCTDEQKKKFDSIINKVLGMMAGPRPEGGNHGMPPPPPL